ncbi:MAG: hypothetical protein H0X24_08525 [Ktedonobacterales bacterium]|nr:hypothetical protein [Ktedonobacterales bacterium]
MRTPRRRLPRVLLAISAGIPVLGFVASHNATLLIYTLFAVALLNRQRVTAAFAHVRLPGAAKFGGAVLISGWLTECFAWLGSYLNHDKNPALFHPQLIPDLILAIGFYGGWAVAWLLVLRRWQFTLGQVFVTTGLMGIFVEQNGAVIAVIIASLGNPLLAALLALYVFAVYGAIMGLPYLLAGKGVPGAGARTGWLKYLAILAGMFFGAKLLFLVVAVVAMALHLIPPRQPIWEHPFF